MKYYYNRSEVINFYDLSDTQKNEMIDFLGAENAENDSFVLLNDRPLPLSHFMRTGSNFIHGVMSNTNTSAYTITLSHCGTMAVVALRG